MADFIAGMWTGAGITLVSLIVFAITFGEREE